MPIKIKQLGYCLQPGERFLDDDDLQESSDVGDESEDKDEVPIELNKEKELLDKLQEIVKRSENKASSWIEKLDVTAPSKCRSDINRNETLKVEEHFKEMALDCVKIGLKKLTRLGIPFNRPSDFYADMVKTDLQMARVVKKLSNRSNAILEKKSKQNLKVKKQFDKQVKQQQRKNKFIKEVNSLRKDRRNNEPVEKQVDRIIDKHSKTQKKGKVQPASIRTKSGNRGNKKVAKQVKKMDRKQKTKQNVKPQKHRKGKSGKRKRAKGR